MADLVHSLGVVSDMSETVYDSRVQLDLRGSKPAPGGLWEFDRGVGTDTARQLGISKEVTVLQTRGIYEVNI